MRKSPLRAYRLEHDLTPQQLADKLEIAVSTLRSLENGNRRFTAEMAKTCEQKLGLSRSLFRADLFDRPRRARVGASARA